jgi:hypothetical protein
MDENTCTDNDDVSEENDDMGFDSLVNESTPA